MRPEYLSLVAVFMILPVCSTSAFLLSEKEILSRADERIEQYRKGDCIIVVTAEDGTPVQGARIVAEQTKHEFLFGVSSSFLNPRDKSAQQGEAQDRFLEIFNYMTISTFHWGWTEKTEGRYDYYQPSALARWGKKNDITVKGHAMLWHATSPGWMNSKSGADKIMEKHVKQYIKKFKKYVDHWDILNESTISLNWNNNAVGDWVRKEGCNKAAETALKWANDADSEKLYVINDYNLKEPFERQIEYLAAKNAHIGAVGLETHMHGGNFSIERVWGLCETYGSFGIPVHFTELTVVSGGEHDGGDEGFNWSPTTAKGEREQADYAEKFYITAFSNPYVQAIVWWDLEDKHSWKKAPAGLLREGMSPKPVYGKIQDLVKNKWWTKKVAADTDENGKCKIRGFYGRYNLTVGAAGGKVKKEIWIRKGEENRVKISL